MVKTRKLFGILILFALTLGTLPLAVMAQPPAPEVQAELEAAASYVPGQPTAQKAPVALPGSVVYFSDFEGDNGGMTGTLDWIWGVYNWNGATCDSGNAPPLSAYSGTGMWGTRLNTCYENRGNNSGYDTCVNGNPGDDSILSVTVDLTGLSDATLSWWEWFDLFMYWDWAEVYANGVPVFQHCGYDYVEPTAWVQQVVDLTPFVGGPVTLDFHMMSSSVVNHAGWFIDDVMVATSEQQYMYAKVKLRGKMQGGAYVVTAFARVVDGQHMPLEMADVTMFLKKPNGNTRLDTRPTDVLGRAVFPMASPTGGYWLACIEDVQYPGFTWDDSGPKCGFLEYPAP